MASILTSPWQQSLEPHRHESPKPNLEMVLRLLPSAGSVPKSVIVEGIREKGIGEKRAMAFINTILAPSGGPVHEWRIKRSGKRDDIHLSREAQPNELC